MISFAYEKKCEFIRREGMIGVTQEYMHLVSRSVSDCLIRSEPDNIP